MQTSMQEKIIDSSHSYSEENISPAVSMALKRRAVLLLLCVFHSASASVVADLDMDYGGVPVRINRLLGEPSVTSLQERMDAAWFRANNPQACPLQCDCPVQWPTALYCDHRGLADIPDSLPNRTQYLFLQANNISSLSSSFLTKRTALRWLILDHNQLQDLVPLQTQAQMYYFFANHNHLRLVPSTLPAGLKELRLAHNQISSISPEAFQNLQNLTLLLLQGNRLQTIVEGDLKGLFSLYLLDLSGNLFSAVPRHLPSSVQQLYMSNNTLLGLEEDSLGGFLNLKYLRLSRCGLESSNVHQQVFNFTSLVELDLSYNKLQTIPTVATALQYLYLEANEIQDFNVNSFCRHWGPLSYSKMKILRLEGNRLSYQQLPSNWVFCLRVLESIYI
ncbi:lumican isoform X2 [Pungitius pungitius]|uniref:lumican isoform X2 n=1 Tax=Pungitius pungitius TaxID=134920 RepID=UPI002E1602DE